jgi:glycosyltransferase involved in cell wall biosynthesis
MFCTGEEGMNKKISILLPTRNRPDMVERLLVSIIDTAKNPPYIEISARTDVDDNLTAPVFFQFRKKIAIRNKVGDRSAIHGDYWNDAWRNSTGGIVMMVGDDFIFRTKGWEAEVRKEFDKFPDGIVLVFGEDGIQHGNIATHAFISRRWTDILGYYVPMQFNVFYHDTWLTDLAQRLGRKVYRPDLVFEHNHHSVGGKVDAVTLEMKERSKNDAEIWAATEPIRVADAEKLRAEMK